MSREENKNFWQQFLDKPRDRKDFLKLSGKSLAGITVSSTVLSLLVGCDLEELPADLVAMPLASGVLISDSNRCTGCRRCELKCNMVNDGKIDISVTRVKVDRNYNYGPNGTGLFQNGAFKPETCKQCKDPVPCATACPMDAIYAQQNTGTRVVNEEKCIGCGLCASACPYKMITVDKETRKSKKCFLCNGEPTCAKFCPNGALKVVPWSEVQTVMLQNRHLFV